MSLIAKDMAQGWDVRVLAVLVDCNYFSHRDNRIAVQTVGLAVVVDVIHCKGCCVVVMGVRLRG